MSHSWTKQDYNMLQGRPHRNQTPPTVARVHPFNASMDSGLLASPSSYQNSYPSKRRPPPPPPACPGTPSPPPGEPPKLPPRNYSRESAQNNNNPNTNVNRPPPTAVPQEPRWHQHQQQPMMVAELQRVATMPASTKPAVTIAAGQNEDSPVDNTKRDFRSLMTQWETNNSPREDRYAAEVRKQAQRFSSQQQLNQQPHAANATPFTVQHSRTKISLARAVWREPTKAMEATPPTSTSSPSSSSPSSLPASSSALPTNAFTSPSHPPPDATTASGTLSSVFPHPSPLSSSSSSPSPSTPSSSLSSPSSTASVSVSLSLNPAFRQPNSSREAKAQTLPNTCTTISPSSSATTSGGGAVAEPCVSSSVPVNAMQPQFLKRTQEETRLRSSSDSYPNESKKGGAGGTSGGFRGGAGMSFGLARERSSSDHDILSDQRHNLPLSAHQTQLPPHSQQQQQLQQQQQQQQLQHQQLQQQQQHPVPSGDAPSRWRPRRGPEILPSSPSSPPRLDQSSGGMVSTGQSEFPPPPPELLLGSDDVTEQDGGLSERFADESYIGHKNKSSRPIGTYQRSKSAALLPSDNNNYKLPKDAGDSPGAFPDHKTLAGQAWNSESVLASVTAGGTRDVEPLPAHLGLYYDPNTAAMGPATTTTQNERVSAEQSLASATASTTSQQAPVRPARPSAAKLAAISSSASSSSTAGPPHSLPESMTAATSVQQQQQQAHFRPLATEHPGWGGQHRDSPRRQPPPPPNSPPYDPSHTTPSLLQASSSSSSPHAQSPRQEPPQSLTGEVGSRNPNSLPHRQPPPHFHGLAQQEVGTPREASLKSQSLPRKDGFYPYAPTQYSPQSTGLNHTATTTSSSSSPSNSILGDSTKDLPRPNFAQESTKQTSSPNNKNNSGDPPATPPRDYQRRENISSSKPVSPPERPEDASSSGKTPTTATATPERAMTASPGSDLNSSSDTSTQSAPVNHCRQPSQEELECDLKARELAQELSGREQKLSQVLQQDANEKRMRFMDGLFSSASTDLTSPPEKAGRGMVWPDGRGDLQNGGGGGSGSDSSRSRADSLDFPKRSSLPKEYWKSAPKAMLEMEMRRNEDMGKDLTRDIQDGNQLLKQKEELMASLRKKGDVLKEAKVSLEDEIAENDRLGEEVMQVVQNKCRTPAEKDKLKTFIEDQEKIVRLLLNLSGQLARAENAVQALGDNADQRRKKMATDKRERLYQKHEDAKSLKDDIGKRSDQICGLLKDRLSEKEFSDYSHFIHMKSKLTIDLQEMEDKLTLGEEQVQELKKSIP